MAKTIEQIQTRITSKGDAREIINKIADYLEFNSIPVTINENKQTVDSNAEDGNFHGLIYAKDKLWAVGKGTESALYRFNDPDDLKDCISQY